MAGNKNKPIQKTGIGLNAAIIIGILCILAGLIVGYYAPERVADVKITAEGEKNAASLGNNIRISKITANKGDENKRTVNFNDVALSGNWEFDYENNLLTCYNITEESNAVFQVSDADSVTIDFVSEVGSGKVQVYINGNMNSSIDLYSNSDWATITKSYDINYAQSNRYIALSLLLMLIGVVCIICIVYKNFEAFKQRLKGFSIKKISRIRLKRAVNTAILAVVLFIITLTVFQSFVFDNIYIENAALTITATGEKEISSLGNNVRITHIIVNDREYDLSEIKLKEGWAYDGINHMMYVYNTTSPASVSIPLENVRTIEIVYVQDVGSGIFNVDVNGKTVKSISGYDDCQWETDSILYKSNPFILPHNSYGTLCLIFAVVFMCVIVLNRNDEKYKKVFEFIGFININFLFSLILYLFISFIQRESIADTFIWIAEYSDNFVEGFCITVLLNIIFAMIFRKNHRSFYILSVVFILLLAINYFKIQFRDTPLLPWDFTLVTVAASVVSRFKLVPSAGFIIMIILLIAVMAAVAVIVKKYSNKAVKIDNRLRIAALAAAIVFMGVYFQTTLLNAGVNLFEAKEYYIEKGFVSAFSESMKYLVPMEEPEDYSEEAMQVIYNNISSIPENSEAQKPNIIVIMSESFWDITRVKELGFNGGEIFPTYRKLQNTSVTGELLTNVYNGGTVNSEFEMLTGFSVAYLPSEYMPYQRCMRPGFFSINSFLESNGYESLAIHPFEKTNYNRNTAYEYLGFDTTLWEEDFDENADRMRGYISDHALTEKIISEYEKHNQDSDAPWFNLSVSMQNHGGYWGSSLDESKAYDVDTSYFSKSSQDSIRDLATGLHYADLALGELIDYFENADEPTVIIMFGDHMSNAGPIGETLLDQSALLGDSDDLSGFGKTVSSGAAKDILEQRRVPFMAWSNYGNTKKDCGIIDIPQLLPTVFSEYNVIMPKYFSYLKECQNIYTACASSLVISSDGSCSFAADMTEEQRELYNRNRLIEYDYIFGEQYLKDLFDK